MFNELNKECSSDEKIEGNLILCTSYQVNDFVIQCGLKPARNFQSAINLMSRKGVLCFSEFEWDILIEILNVENICRLVGNVQVTINTCSQQKIAILEEKNTTVILLESSMKKLMNLKRLLEIRVQLLNALNFSDFYNNFIRKIRDICKMGGLSTEYLINQICELNPCIHTLGIYEVLYFVNSKIVNDISYLY